nr:hypothetical protein [Tanacetum cinerariifolium]
MHNNIMYQKEVNEICAERISKNAILALVVAAQQYPELLSSTKTYAPRSKQSSFTRSHASTKYKGKEIAKPITPLSESASEEDSDPVKAHREIDEQELEAHYSYIEKIKEVPTINSRTDTKPLEKTDQNAEDECAALANLIANLTLDTEEKNILKQLKKANTSLTQELKKCKSNLEKSNTIRDSFLIIL